MEKDRSYPAVAALKMAQIQKRQAERYHFADLALSAIRLERRATQAIEDFCYTTCSCSVRMQSMKLIFAAILLLPAMADAKEVAKTARSNVPTRVYTYFSWDENCQSTTGVVRLVSKPLNGQLKTSEVSETINKSRTTQQVSRCAGTSIRGFRVDYISNPGFRGEDHFKTEVNYKNKRPEIDNFTVDVR